MAGSAHVAGYVHVAEYITAHAFILIPEDVTINNCYCKIIECQQ